MILDRTARSSLCLLLLFVAGCQTAPPTEEPNLVPLGPSGPPRAVAVADPIVVAPPEEPLAPRDGPHLFVFSVGPGYWPGIGDVDPSSSGFPPSDFGDFEEWGFGFSMGYEGRVAQFETGELWVGGQFMVSSFENERGFDVLFLPSGHTIDGEFSADLFSITPTIAYRANLSDRVEAFARGGAGYYRLALQESFDGYYDDIDDDDSFGGFIALGIDIQLADEIALRIEDQIHFADLEAFPDVLPAEGTVDDPIHMFQIGVSFRF